MADERCVWVVEASERGSDEWEIAGIYPDDEGHALLVKNALETTGELVARVVPYFPKEDPS